MARDAGVSKGGLLHHFANKKALLDGFHAGNGNFQARHPCLMQKDPVETGRATRAYISMAAWKTEKKARPCFCVICSRSRC
ncbi:TetR/AcrR family transcriptional regulator [Acetobacter aceti]|uniref:TetR/AcrR family transcriptional regulator n=1 Tax=Acetobacter aceti TaxID=435 RepID=UPI0002260552|nr:TetR/AcrR family transcriptional regulator [Acetobacter aceti]